MNGKAAKQFLENFQKGYGLMQGFMRNKETADATNAQVEELAPVSEIKVEDGAEPVKTDVSAKQYKFLGQTYDKPLTEQQISTARNRAIANANKRWGNAVEGMRMENDLLTQEREGAKFDAWKKEAEDKDRVRELTKQRDQIIAGANKPADVGTGFALDGQAGGTMAFNSQGNANTVLENFSDVVKPEVKPAAWTDRLDGDRKLYTGLNSAVQAKQYNDSNPITSYSRYRQIYDQLSAIPGMSEEADKYLTKLKTAKQEGAFDVLGRLERGDIEGAYAIGNQMGQTRWPEGSRLVKTGEQSGENLLGYNGAKYSLVGPDGRVLADDVVATLNRSILGPEKIAEMSMAAAGERKKREEWKEDQKELILFRDGVRDGNVGTGSSGGGSKKPPPSPADVASGLFMDAIKNASSQQNLLMPEQINAGDTATRTAISLNPGISPEVAATAGMVFANTKPGSTTFSWDPASNSVVEQVQTPQGLVAINRVTHRNAAARRMPPEKLKLAVESSISSLAGTDPAKRQKVIAAAFDNTGKARRALLDDAKAELMAMPQFRALTPQGQAEALKAHERNVDQALTVPLGWIRNFGQDLNK